MVLSLRVHMEQLRRPDPPDNRVLGGELEKNFSIYLMSQQA